MRKLIITIILLISQIILSAQDCPSSLYNGNFEELTGISNATPSLGISKGAIANWYATHGTADYLTPEWDWYEGLGFIESNVGHICYGNRQDHKHSEGMYTESEFVQGRTYTVSFDFGSICDRTETGRIHMYLNNNLEPAGHNFFLFPTNENSPQLFSSSQKIDELELTTLTDARFNGYSKYEFTFTAEENFSQLWFFTSFDYDGDDNVNCGFLIDDVTISSYSDELKDIHITQNTETEYTFSPVFEEEVYIENYSWTVNGEKISNDASFTYEFENGEYTVCLDIVDEKNACGNQCKQFTIGAENATDLCSYTSCLDFGGVPMIADVEVANLNGEIERLGADHPDFNFPYCLSSQDFCFGNDNNLEKFVSDVNNWLTKQGLFGNVSIIDNSDGFYNTCRSKVLSISDVEIDFFCLIFADQDGNEYRNEFTINQELCTSSDQFVDETEIELVQERITDISSPLTVDVYPNPFVDSVSISSREEILTKIEIFNMSGEIVFEETLANVNEAHYELNELEGGMYVLQVSAENESNAYKIIKN